MMTVEDHTKRAESYLHQAERLLDNTMGMPQPESALAAATIAMAHFSAAATKRTFELFDDLKQDIT